MRHQDVSCANKGFFRIPSGLITHLPMILSGNFEIYEVIQPASSVPSDYPNSRSVGGPNHDGGPFAEHRLVDRDPSSLCTLPSSRSFTGRLASTAANLGRGHCGSMAASLLTFWLFLPVAAAIGMCTADLIAAAVERKFYPGLPPPNGAHVAEQIWDGIVVAVKVLILNVLALMLAVLLPGLGIILGLDDHRLRNRTRPVRCSRHATHAACCGRVAVSLKSRRRAGTRRYPGPGCLYPGA